ncbi:MAG: SCP2 sterol-binding domain-containing protein [Pseudomonadota bacterium]
MKYWDNPEQPITAFLKLMEVISEDEELLKGMMKVNQLIWFDYTQDGPDCSFWSDSRNNQFSHGPGKPAEEPDLVLSLSADEGHLSWSNKLNAVMAITRGKIKVKGSAVGLLKLAPKQKKTAQHYQEALRRLGWEDKILK